MGVSFFFTAINLFQTGGTYPPQPPVDGGSRLVDLAKVTTTTFKFSLTHFYHLQEGMGILPPK